MTSPYADLLGASVERDATGAAIVAMPFADDVLGRPGFLHGGAIGGLLDLAARTALRDAVGAGAGIEMVTLTVDYRRGGRDAITHAAGTVTRLGGRIANVDAAAWQDDRARPIATARLTFTIER